VSPILFLIYIRELFQSSLVRYLLYIDNISITVILTSFRKNVEILEQEATKLYELGAQNAIQFDLAKTKLIHFAKCAVAKCAEAKGALKLPDGETI
jgi:hypothetical protein